MTGGARTPEDLETLLEDTFVLRDGEAIAELFEDGAVLVADGTRHYTGRTGDRAFGDGDVAAQPHLSRRATPDSPGG